MRDVAPGEVGEIVHRSPHLMLGYFHDDERTKAAFEGGWFHSGDLGDDRRRRLHQRRRPQEGHDQDGRRERRQPRGGRGDLPAAAGLGSGGGGRASSQVGGSGGGGGGREAGAALDEDAVLAHCAAAMAGFKVPKRVVFAEALPKNPSGKLLKRQLRRPMPVSSRTHKQLP
jgi:fatty-acyl-CoA synthase